MNFLEAQRLLAKFAGGPPLPFLFATSGTPDKLDVFLRAAAAKHGRSAQVRTLPFNTLAQFLLSEPAAEDIEVLVLFPWDLVPAADWRSGVPKEPLHLLDARTQAESTIARMTRRNARMLYVPALIPPLFSTTDESAALSALLLSLMYERGAQVLPADAFSLGSYLSSGSPFAGPTLGATAASIVNAALGHQPPPRKVLVTDLDNVLWQGVIGEDGVDGIVCAPEGAGFRFFLYQTFLAKLEGEGVLIAAVSRNDEELALAPFRAQKLALTEQQFVCIIATYGAKSAQIAEIATRLNLGLDSFVFVDDNPLELAEVSTKLPGVETVAFPPSDEGMPAFLQRLRDLFTRATITSEDRERTAFYRRRMAGMAPAELAGADLTSFLADLRMRLTLHDRSSGDRTRAVQLINKTNQFNLNGRRVTDEEVAEILANGGVLFTASLEDKNGAHGEILAFLASADGAVESFVMSCRVFQRRVEHAFLAWLSSSERSPRLFKYELTPRNEPIRQFLNDAAFASTDTGVKFDAAKFRSEHAGALALFDVREPGPATEAVGVE
jgi:FkbH-like protein